LGAGRRRQRFCFRRLGQDSYAFADYGAQNADSVLNFDSNWDSIQLDAGGFANIGATGRFAGGDVPLYAAAGANRRHDTDDRIVYNTSTGQLFYDPDGDGTGAAQLIATFQGAPGMAAGDINVFGSTATPSPTPSPTPTPTPRQLRTPTPTPTPTGSQNISGTSGNDTLIGRRGHDTIFGNSGNDWIEGRGGNDWYQAARARTATCSASSARRTPNSVANFDTNWDSLRFDSAAFTAAGAAGRFAAGDGALLCSGGRRRRPRCRRPLRLQHLTGQLYYDADGSGAGDPQLVPRSRRSAVAANDSG